MAVFAARGAITTRSSTGAIQGMAACLLSGMIDLLLALTLFATPTERTIARMCYLEAGMSEPDCVAMRYVVTYRARVLRASARTAAREYSAALKRRPMRAVPTDGRWYRLLGIVRSSQVNPCPRAAHWGSRTARADKRNARRMIRAGKWYEIRCDRPTLNAFYGLVDRKR